MERRNFLKQAMAAAAGSALLPGAVSGRSLWEEEQPLTIDTKLAGRALAHFWSKCIGAGRANDGLQASWLEHLQFAKKYCGFEYYRVHGLFHDDMSVYKGGVYNWQHIDELFDRTVKAGIKPFVELSFFPKEIAGGAGTAFWWKANVSPPNDFTQWGMLVGNFAKHCVERYGLNEVSTWYFEVWHEPDLKTYWDGTRSQYFALYKTSALALKAISPKLKVGGPATSNFVGDARFDGETEDKTKHLTNSTADLDTLKWKGVWIEEFLAYCQQEQLPVDFISTHPYPTDFALNPGTSGSKGRTRNVDATQQDLQSLKAAVAKSAYPKAEIHLTEWSASSSPRNAMNDYMPTAAYIIKANVDSIGLADSLAYQMFTDASEETGASIAFHGGPGMLSYHGIPKPAFHAYRMLHLLGDELLYNKEGIIVTRHKATQRLTTLVYNYPAALKTAPPFGGADVAESTMKLGEPRNFTFKLANTTKDARFNVEILDRENGNAIAAWKQLGSPEPPADDQIKSLRQMAMAVKEEQVLASNQGVLLISKILQPWDVMLIDETR